MDAEASPGPQDEVLVPALVGLEIGEAHALALSARVVVASADPVDPLPTTGVVSAQQPLAGIAVPPATTVSVLVDTDGGGGGGSSGAPVPPAPLDPAGTA